LSRRKEIKRKENKNVNNQKHLIESEKNISEHSYDYDDNYEKAEKTIEHYYNDDNYVDNGQYYGDQYKETTKETKQQNRQRKKTVQRNKNKNKNAPHKIENKNIYSSFEENHSPVDTGSGNIKWGEKMWEEVEKDWNKNTENWKKKYRVRKKKTDLPKSDVSKNLPAEADPNIGSDDGAKYLSAWANAGELLQNQPKLKFVDDKRDFVSGFKPTAGKSANEENYVNFGQSSYFNPSDQINKKPKVFSTPNLENHSLTSSSYDEKMIIKPQNLANPPSFPNVQNPPNTFHSFQDSSLRRSGLTRTKTLQELTFRS